MLSFRRKLKKVIISVLILSLTVVDFNVIRLKNQSKNVYAMDEEEGFGVNEYGLANKTEEGTILHAFSWNFNTIKDRMEEIKDCGYSTIQVSPIEKCYEGSRQHTWEWENTYQPVEYTIGNYIVGTKEEFEDMVKEAHKYGIKIIVDVVANHISDHSDQVSKHFKNSKLYHNNGDINDWNSRWAVTQQDLMKMPDFNTQSYDVQDLMINYLDECMEAGADGFRFDAAKHIELPSDTGFASDYWPNIINFIKSKKSDAFVYGEILQDSIDNYIYYAALMGTSGDNYSRVLREAISNKDLSKDLCSYYVPNGVSSDRIVTYAETHDTFSNPDGTSREFNEWQIKKAYEIIAAREKGVPLFLARPKFTEYTANNKLDGPIGESIDDWKDPEVVEVNKFRNAMIGKDEYIRKISDNTIAIERGIEGMVVINLDGGYNGTIPTRIQDGLYKDQVSGNYFRVCNGNINVNVNSGRTAVIYNKNVENNANKNEDSIIKASLKLPLGWGEPYAYVYEESNGEIKNNSSWPGEKMINNGNGIYSYYVDSSFKKPLIIFSDGNNQYPNANEKGLELKGSMLYEDGKWIEK